MGTVVKPSASTTHFVVLRGREFQLAVQQAVEDRYVLQGELGRGGYGVVYLAWEKALERKVALKVLPPAIAGDGRRERFLREARIAARLKHDHIVPIHAVGESGPFVYYTMDYIEGETLLQRIFVEGWLSPGETARIMREVAWAVDYAHRQGVIHRDLKPNNILLERSTGRAYVTDFGIARLMEEAPLLGGLTFGTFTYASPEQAAGIPADHRSDIYSLGVVAYVTATGKTPFSGTAKDVLADHVRTPAPPLRVVGENLDTTLSEAVARCLAKDPRERFQTAADFARALSATPELRGDLPLEMRQFLTKLKVRSRWTPGRTLAGLAGIGVLTRAAGRGEWGMAALALGALWLLSAMPVVAALISGTRRLLRSKENFGRDDIVQALAFDIERQKDELALRRDGTIGGRMSVLEWVTLSAFGLFGLGALAAMTGLNLPFRLVFGSISLGALTFLFAGALLWARKRERNKLSGVRWLRFFKSGFGEWAVRLLRVSLKRDAELDAPAEPRLPAGPARNGKSELEHVSEIVHVTDACAERLRQRLQLATASRTRDGRTATPEEQEFENTLQGTVAMLEAMGARLLALAEGGGGSLTGDIQVLREAREAVQYIIDARQELM